MESPRKFNDCYFYYYSTCTKGDNCVFRHEPSALGCETMCTAWQQGKCLDKRCKLRHMELRKNRKQIPCYWENQPGGCRKKHCPFMHKNPDARTDGIAPSQPAPALPVVLYQQAQPMNNISEVLPIEQQSLPSGMTPAIAQPAPVPLLWQQQRQVVLDSAILGVLPASSDLLGGRRVLPPHAHDPSPNPYAQHPVDPLVVNFEEESDNESAPSSTPTKVSTDEEQRIARTKSQELLLLERIQAEAAAYYSYETLPSAEPKERKLVRTNLSTKYERLSLDEIAGKGERRSSADFKVLSLEEIRARKKTETTTIVHSAPITLNLSRKRKLSTQETITTSGNKIIKVVRSNSIVYKKVEQPSTAVPNHTKVDKKQSDHIENRKRTLSEQSDVYEIQEDELVDNCYEFKRIKLANRTSKPRLIRNRHLVANTGSTKTKEDEPELNNKTDDSDTEVQIIRVELPDKNTDVESLSDNEVIEIETSNLSAPIDIVDLSDDLEESDINVLDLDLNLGQNVPDVVASCHKPKVDSTERDLLKDIDDILDEDL